MSTPTLCPLDQAGGLGSHKLFSLVQRDGERFKTTDPSLLGARLEAAGWRWSEPRAPTEAARYWHHSALIVVYHSGAVTTGGRRFWLANDVLGRLCPVVDSAQLDMFVEVQR
jgi:hypothetical protein